MTPVDPEDEKHMAMLERVKIQALSEQYSSEWSGLGFSVSTLDNRYASYQTNWRGSNRYYVIRNNVCDRCDDNGIIYLGFRQSSWPQNLAVSVTCSICRIARTFTNLTRRTT